ncbi:MAG: rhomboid family intramembrane serine protease [Proteobacteria bacterium]|nr:rhomboid family intramembrane serine protease [Pseudomonadota bacterium]
MSKAGSSSSGETMASVAVRSGLPKAEADALALLFASMGLASRLQARSKNSFTVLVPAEQLERANELLAEEYPEILQSDDPEGAETVSDSRPEQLGVVIAITAACLAAFFFTHGGLDPVGKARMIQMGAITWSLVEAGEYWRLLSAVFLHFDLGHIMSNMVMLWILGPHLAREMRAWPFLLTFMVAGIAGNVASHILTPSMAVKAGASGGVAGILGALAGLSLPGRRSSGSRPSWQVIGAMAAIYGMAIGFGPGRDNTAHLGGLLAGVVAGIIFKRREEAPPGFGPATRNLPRSG